MSRQLVFRQSSLEEKISQADHDDDDVLTKTGKRERAGRMIKRGKSNKRVKEARLRSKFLSREWNADKGFPSSLRRQARYFSPVADVILVLDFAVLSIIITSFLGLLSTGIPWKRKRINKAT